MFDEISERQFNSKIFEYQWCMNSWINKGVQTNYG